MKTEPRAGLSETQIVEATKGLLLEHGVEGLTMRLLSDRLGVALGATYRHVPNKHALLELVAQSLYADIGKQEARQGDDVAQVKDVMLAVRKTFGRYPGMAAYMGAHMSAFESPMVLDRLRTPLSRLGLSAEQTSDLIISLALFTAGHLLVNVEPHLRRDVLGIYRKGLDLLVAGALTQVARERALM